MVFFLYDDNVTMNKFKIKDRVCDSEMNYGYILAMTNGAYIVKLDEPKKNGNLAEYYFGNELFHAQRARFSFERLETKKLLGDSSYATIVDEDLQLTYESDSNILWRFFLEPNHIIPLIEYIMKYYDVDQESLKVRLRKQYE